MTDCNTTLAVLVGCLLSGAGSPAAADKATLPAPGGPYAIGRVSYEMTDVSRPEPLSPSPGVRRRFMVYVWYPADREEAKGKAPAPYLPGFEEVRSRMNSVALADMFRPGAVRGADSLPETAVIDNAPIARGKQKFPLLLFSHGWGNPTFLYTAELQDIVSHGYVIAAVDHPYDTSYTRFPNGEVTFFAKAHFDQEVTKEPHGVRAYTRERVEVMAEDNRYALTQLLKYAGDRSPDAPFSGRVDPSNIGAFGHSIGGLTAARTCQIDPRVKACMDQDSTDYRGSPFVVSGLDETEKQPFFLFVVSSADVWSPRALNPTDAELAQQKLTRAEFDAIMKQQQENQTKQLRGISGGSYRLMLFDLPGFVHRSFTDQTLMAGTVDREQGVYNFRVAEAYTLAFFGKYLKGDTKTILDSGETADRRARIERFRPH